MPKKPKPPKKAYRDMPDNPPLLAKAMFDAADRKLEEGRAAKKPAAQGRWVRYRQPTRAELAFSQFGPARCSITVAA